MPGDTGNGNHQNTNGYDNGTAQWRPHPDFTNLSDSYLKLHEATLDEEISWARDASDPDPTLLTFLQQEMRMLQNERTRRNGALPSPDKPQPLLSELPPVKPMVAQIIPEPFRAWLCDISERMQCPLDFPVIGAVVAAASLIGRRLAIRPKRQDDWEVVPNLWGGIVGRPGIMKTPALADVMGPLMRLEHEALQESETKKREYEVKTLIVKAQKQELEKKIKAAVTKGNDPAKFAYTALPAGSAEPLVLRRYVVNDSTVEKLGELLNQNPFGLLLFRDELTGWLKSLDREGHENDRAFYLEAWNGNGSYTYDRIGRGTLHIPAACVSVLGGIQPGPLNDYLQWTLKGGAGADGLFQRFQVLVYPDDPGPWQNIDRWPDTHAKNNAFEIFQKLAGESFVSFVSSIPSEFRYEQPPVGPPFLRFSPGAQGFFDNWRLHLENKIRAGDDHPIIEAHLSKFRSLMPSLALVFHVLSSMSKGRPTNPQPVGETAAAMAAAWCDYLELHARRIYHGLINQDLSTANLLAKKIQKGQVPKVFTAREIYRKGWTGLSNQGSVEKALAVLEESCWVQSVQIMGGPSGGRPTLQYSLHPDLYVNEGAER